MKKMRLRDRRRAGAHGIPGINLGLGTAGPKLYAVRRRERRGACHRRAAPLRVSGAGGRRARRRIELVGDHRPARGAGRRRRRAEQGGGTCRSPGCSAPPNGPRRDGFRLSAALCRVKLGQSPGPSPRVSSSACGRSRQTCRRSC